METAKHQIVSAHGGIRKLEESIGENKSRAKGFYVITWLAEALDKLNGTEYAVQCGIVYGPFARGAKRFQQIDLLLVLESNADEELAEEFIVDEILSKIYMEVRIFLYLGVLNPESLKLTLEHPTPIMMAVQKEGIVFYGHNVLNQSERNVSRTH